MNKWRFIPLMKGDGKLHMAIDEWLLIQHQKYNHPSTLRFYTWNPPAISLGVSQKRHFPSHWQNLTYQGKPIDLVKRPSGGRGVLHQGDLTYMVITSHLDGNLDQVYRQICQFLILGWQKLGVDLQFGQPERQYLHSANCFKLATNADLVDRAGNKFIGSSQLKKGKFTLQHGSMLLKPDKELFQKVFNTVPPKTILSSSICLESIVNILTKSAEDYFNCQFEIQPLSPQELNQIQKMITL
ncbi:lipoate--protein ligase family protein [Geminocystis sp. NIES-3709]|uniref:lipoate--protein ligase family protein n=1 Tax=Geminocystis sp. NIES-3709 TaxID=1617448 RepID=UPI0005FCCE92|nr:lipoate--protein ligase family protein [Geminocystis sp. NIES-3709]BAQ64087.1 lipoate-protein ligase A [Geminocystis sp. NIES-3709]